MKLALDINVIWITLLTPTIIGLFILIMQFGYFFCVFLYKIIKYLGSSRSKTPSKLNESKLLGSSLSNRDVHFQPLFMHSALIFRNVLTSNASDESSDFGNWRISSKKYAYWHGSMR